MIEGVGTVVDVILVVVVVVVIMMILDEQGRELNMRMMTMKFDFSSSDMYVLAICDSLRGGLDFLAGAPMELVRPGYLHA